MSSNPEKGEATLKNLEEVLMKEVELVECLQRAVNARKELDWETAMEAYAHVAAIGFQLACNAQISKCAWAKFEEEVNNA